MKAKQGKVERPYRRKYDVVDGKHVCPVCCKLTSKGRMAGHLRIHDKEKQFKCEKCDKTFLERHLLKKHVSHVHENVSEEPQQSHVHDKIKLARTFGCDICGKKYNQMTSLKSHMNIHAGVKPYECDLCKEKFFTRNQVKCHKISKHTKRFRCKFCSKFFTDVKMLRKHELMHRVEQWLGPEPKKKKPVKKEPVKEPVKEPAKQVKKPKVVKKEERIYQCDECGVIFKALPALEQHQKVHEENTKSSTVTE